MIDRAGDVLKCDLSALSGTIAQLGGVDYDQIIDPHALNVAMDIHAASDRVRETFHAHVERLHEEIHATIGWNPSAVSSGIANQIKSEFTPFHVPLLICVLNDPDQPAHIVRYIVSILKLYGVEASPAVFVLKELLNKNDSELIGDVVLALGKIGPLAREAADPLARLMLESNHPDWVYCRVIETLGSIRALPELRKLLDQARLDKESHLAEHVKEIEKTIAAIEKAAS